MVPPCGADTRQLSTEVHSCLTVVKERRSLSVIPRAVGSLPQGAQHAKSCVFTENCAGVHRRLNASMIGRSSTLRCRIPNECLPDLATLREASTEEP